uniref:Ig-like domain-containing protein n=1 Tax=Poecilia formosa TaxID=48698 RepID=A0A096LS13_POEFO
QNVFLCCLLSAAALSCVRSAAGLIRVFGYEGADAKVSCSYPEGYESYEKYLCRNDCDYSDVLITTSQTNKPRHSIYDDKRTRTFTTTISNLQSTDAGKYWCGVTRNGKDLYTEVKLETKQGINLPNSKVISKTAGHEVTLQCPYPPNHQNNRKFLCRGSQRSNCADMMKGQIHTGSRYNDRVSCFSISGVIMKSGIFTVTISSLTLKDSGSYLCGVQRNSGFDVFTAVELEVKAPLSSAAGSIRVFGYEGGDVNVSCPYDRGFEGHQKYLCNHDCRYADVLITTSQGSSGKYSIHDDKTTRIFTVTISDLRLDDAGKYWCGVTRIGRDISIETFAVSNSFVFLSDRCCDTVNHIQGTEDGSVTISCPYDSQSVNKLKFFCRGNRPSTCLQQAVITSSNTQDGRFRLSDDRKSGIFTVTISSLTLKNSGSYLCGVQRNSGFDVFTAVQLEVKGCYFYSSEWCCAKSKNMSGVMERSVTFQCPYAPQHHNDTMFLCKGDGASNCTDMMGQSRFVLSNVSSSSFSVTVTKLEAGDAGTYWCGSGPEANVGNFTRFHLSVERKVSR